jgi:DNA-binding beta-propeller fold protein YncE
LAEEPYLRRVQTFKLSELDVAEPFGLAFSPAATSFLGAQFQDNTGFIGLTFAENIDSYGALAAAIPDPVNIAFAVKSNSLFFFDDSTEELIEVTIDADGSPDTDSEAITRFDAGSFGVKEARGMTFDPETGNLFFLVASGAPTASRIVQLIPDSQDRFEFPEVVNIPLPSLGQMQLSGIAFNPQDNHLYLMDPVDQRLYEISPQGNILTNRDLSIFALSDVQNMVFAPSRDQTDDPAIQSLYIANSAMGSAKGHNNISEFSLTQPEVLDLSDITVKGSLVQTIHTSEWSPPSPDPSGAVYIPISNNLLISDGEVNEMPIFTGVNIWEVTLTGGQVQEFSTTAFSDEPTGVAFNPNNQHLFFSDDTGAKTVYEMDSGPDGLYGTSDDTITSFRTGDFLSRDPEGIAFDKFQGHLFISDGADASNAEVYEISPGENGLFDGVPPVGDDVVNQFDTSILGIHDPEGLEFNSDNGNLYIVGRADDIIVETTTAGTAVRVIDIAFLNATELSGLAYAPSSVNPLERSLYLVDRGVDNDIDPGENDGRIYEISLGRFAPSIMINNAVVTEGDQGTFDAEFTVWLSGISEQTVLVDYVTTDGSATTGSDYVAVSGQMSFQPGETSQTIIVRCDRRAG